MMPAMRAAPSTSPFFASPARIVSSVSGFMMTAPSATAVRTVSALSPTSTMLASPDAPRWVSLLMSRRDPLSEQRLRGKCHVFLAHQAFADQEGRDVDARQAHAVVMSEDAALADDDLVLRDELCQPFRRFERDLEGAQVAVVDADERRGEGLERPLKL